jgi:hypothetical protein
MGKPLAYRDDIVTFQNPGFVAGEERQHPQEESCEGEDNRRQPEKMIPCPHPVGAGNASDVYEDVYAQICSYRSVDAASCRQRLHR